MKKIILTISGFILFSTVAMGCSTNKIEDGLITRGNNLVEEKYQVEIEKDNYTYSIGEVINNNEFVNIEEKVPKEVFLRAVSKDKPSDGKVFSYSIKFNTKTDEILSSECEIIKNKN
ncbi:MAG: hypothetical protein ACRC57_04945 [Sarcina sp.]